jgi:2-iminobutanoate/2-iminopropanoate deaminase
MSKELAFVATDAAPKAIGPYSQAVVCGELIFVSGQIPLDPATGELVGSDFAQQAERALANIKAVLEAAGSSVDRIVKVNVYLVDLAQFGQLNAIYGAFLGAHRPARAVVQVSALPRGAQIEVEAVAVR